VTNGRGPAAPGGASRSSRSGDRDSRPEHRSGESGEEIADLGAIRRTEALLNAFTAGQPGDWDPAAAHSTTANVPNARERGTAGRGTAGRGTAGRGTAGSSASEPITSEPGGGEPGAAQRGTEGGSSVDRSGAGEPCAVPRLLAHPSTREALSVLAALVADVDEHAWPSTHHRAGRGDDRIREIRAACGKGRRPGIAGTGTGRIMLACWRAGMRHGMAMTVAASVVVSGAAAAAIHGRLPWLVTMSGATATGGRTPVSSGRGTPRDLSSHPQTAVTRGISIAGGPTTPAPTSGLPTSDPISPRQIAPYRVSPHLISPRRALPHGVLPHRVFAHRVFAHRVFAHRVAAGGRTRSA